MADDIRYCTTSDGVRIAYAIDGAGPPLLEAPALVGSFALRHLARSSVALHSALTQRMTVIGYDQRGTGLSDRDVTDLSADAMTNDLEAVIEAAGLGPVTIFASALSGPHAIRLAVRRPDLVSRLTLVDTTPTPQIYPREAMEALALLARANWPLAAQTLADSGIRAQAPEEERALMAEQALELARLIERSADGQFVARLMLEAYEGWDINPLLPLVAVPTLVMHHRDNAVFPVGGAHTIAAAIPGARLMLLQGNTVGAQWDGSMREIVDAIHRFAGAIADDAPASAGPGFVSPASGTAVILFTDIADSTPLTERLGDAAFREASRALDAQIRGAITAASGTPVDGKLLGDGVMGVFTSAAQAIDAARRCLALSAASELRLHIGLHAGDVIREGGNVYGGAVNIAARICALSAAGEILVSGTVRDLARTSAGVSFEDRGEQALKGIADPVRVFAVG